MKNSYVSLYRVAALSVVLISFVGLSYNSVIIARSHAKKAAKAEKIMKQKADNVYDFELTREDGKCLKLADFKGKVLLIVNTAARCGFASQYKELEELYQKYKNQGLVIIGVSSNDFGQEIEDQEERTCSIEDHVVTTFLMADTVHVKGKNADPLFVWLNKKGGWFGSVKWNFHKFLIGKDGEYIDWYAPTTSPQKKKVIKAIEKALAA